jgi:hypothetical protein
MSTDILDALDKDGATYELEDGRTLRLSIHPDNETTPRDYECYGEYSEYAYRYLYNEGHTPRPAGFDGNAEKIEVDRGYWVWWQPPRGDYAPIDPATGKVARRDSETFREMRRAVLDLWHMGFCGVVLTVLEECDHGHEHEVASASLWGIDSLDNGYLREVVGDLLSEVNIEAE